MTLIHPGQPSTLTGERAFLSQQKAHFQRFGLMLTPPSGAFSLLHQLQCRKYGLDVVAPSPVIGCAVDFASFIGISILKSMPRLQPFKVMRPMVHNIAMSTIENQTLRAQISFLEWLERRYFEELRQMTFTSPVQREVQAMIQEFDARPADDGRQRRIVL